MALKNRGFGAIASRHFDFLSDQYIGALHLY